MVVQLLKVLILKTQSLFNMIHYYKKFGTKLDDLDVPGKLQNAAKSYITLGQGEQGKQGGIGREQNPLKSLGPS